MSSPLEGSSSGSGISSPDVALLFEKFKDYFDARFSAIDQPSSDPDLQKLKAKLAAKELSKPGNQAQFEFCGLLEVSLGRIRAALSTTSSDSKLKALEALQEAESLLAERKKKIRIADSSKAGWSTIAHLDRNEGSGLSADQQKRVLAAEDAALQEQNTRKRLRQDGPNDRPSVAGSQALDKQLFRGPFHFHSISYPSRLPNTLIFQWQCADLTPMMQ